MSSVFCIYGKSRQATDSEIVCNKTAIEKSLLKVFAIPSACLFSSILSSPKCTDYLTLTLSAAFLFEKDFLTFHITTSLLKRVLYTILNSTYFQLLARVQSSLINFYTMFFFSDLVLCSCVNVCRICRLLPKINNKWRHTVCHLTATWRNGKSKTQNWPKSAVLM